MNHLDTNYQYQQMVDVSGEGEEKVAPAHASVDVEYEIKDRAVANWVRFERLDFMRQHVYLLRYADLKTLNNDEVEALATNLNAQQRIRFKRAIETLRTRGTLGTRKPVSGKKTEGTFKLILIGDNEVGKTSLMHRCTRDEFEYEYTATITEHAESRLVQLRVWCVHSNVDV